MTQKEQIAQLTAEVAFLRVPWEKNVTADAGMIAENKYLRGVNAEMQRNIVDSVQQFNSMREERDRLKALLDMEYEHRETLRKL